MNFGSDSRSPVMVKCYHFGDPLISNATSSSSQNYYF